MGDHGEHKGFFHTTYSYPVLFNGINVNSTTSCTVACLVLFLLAIAYNAVKCGRKYIQDNSSNETTLSSLVSPIHLAQSVLYVIQFSGGYILMLVVMTYNVWLIAAVMSGFGVGYFLFGWNEFIPYKKDRVAVKSEAKPQHELQPLTQEDVCFRENDLRT